LMNHYEKIYIIFLWDNQYFSLYVFRGVGLSGTVLRATV